MNCLAVFQINPGWHLVLASASPRRKELLANLGLEFAILKPDINEPHPETGEDPQRFVERCAKIKTDACLLELGKKEKLVILGADTIVALDGEIIGKPANSEDALEILQRLNGVQHQVFTALNLNIDGKEVTQLCLSKVSFHKWPQEVLKAYIASGDSLDKAGAYGIQGKGAFLVKSIEGSPTNVMGLPVGPVLELLLKYDCASPHIRVL